MNKTLRPLVLAAAALASSLAMAAPDASPGYPTVDRVLYVEACVATHPGNRFEMVNKCSCALDAMAAELPYEDFVEMSTAANANSIGGERGSYIRDVEVLQTQIKRYRELRNKTFKGCFLEPNAK